MDNVIPDRRSVPVIAYMPVRWPNLWSAGLVSCSPRWVPWHRQGIPDTSHECCNPIPETILPSVTAVLPTVSEILAHHGAIRYKATVQSEREGQPRQSEENPLPQDACRSYGLPACVR